MDEGALKSMFGERGKSCLLLFTACRKKERKKNTFLGFSKNNIFHFPQDDIGVSGVIGSAVFNITLVIAVCALAAKEVFYLNWWSVVRDCVCYLLSIIVLLCTIANEIVSWYEALFFLLLYVLYCVGMAFNSRIEAAVKARVRVPDSWQVTQPGPATATSNPDEDANGLKRNGN